MLTGDSFLVNLKKFQWNIVCFTRRPWKCLVWKVDGGSGGGTICQRQQSRLLGMVHNCIIKCKQFYPLILLLVTL